MFPKKIKTRRHDESKANAGQKTSDPYKIELSDVGLAAANEFARDCVLSPSVIASSTLQRALQSSGPLWQKYPSVRRLLLPQAREFCFFNFARHEPKSTLERKRDTQAYWRRADPDECSGPYSECFRSFWNRIGELNDIFSGLPHGSLVVTHGFTMAAYRYAHTNGFSFEDKTMGEVYAASQRWPIANGEQIEFAIDSVAQRSGLLQSPQQWVVVDFASDFAESVANGSKTQTIRARKLASVGSTLVLVAGKGEAKCQLLGHAILNQIVPFRLEETHSRLIGFEDGRELCASALDAMAKADGFDSGRVLGDFLHRQYGLPFTGFIHYWSQQI